MRSLNIVVVEPDESRARAVAEALSQDGGCRVAILSDAAGLRRRIAEVDPDVVLIDMAIPRNDLAPAGAGLDSAPLAPIFAAMRAEGREVPMAMTFPGGTQDLWMRYWLAAGGIDPNTDVDLIEVPPPQMVANMKTGTMVAFCVGEPWNAQLVNEGIGYNGP